MTVPLWAIIIIVLVIAAAFVRTVWTIERDRGPGPW